MTAMSPGSTPGLTSRSAFVCAAMLFAIVGLAWWQAVTDARRMSSMLDGLADAGSAMPFDTSPVRFAGMWIAMMAAMMLPGIIPLVAAGGHMRPLSAMAIASGYLAVWLPTGAIAFVALTAINEVSHPNPWVNRIGGVVVALAGAYQFTGYKRRLAESHGSRDQQPRAAHAVGVGVSHGVRCLGCSWALMSVLLVVGVMNLGWMAVISAVCVGEKTLTQRRAFGSAVGCALITLGLVVLVNPHTLTAIAEIG